MRALWCAAVLSCLIGSAARGQDKGPLIGTWKVAAIALPNQPKISSPQPGLYIFTPQYYSVVRINSDKPGPGYASRAQAKDSDIVALYDTLMAESGTYTVVGNRLRTHPLTAKNPSAASGSETEYEFDISSRTLVLTSHPPDRGAPEVVILTRVEY